MTRKAYLPGPGRMTQALTLVRRISGQTQEAIAPKVGLSRASIAHREAGERPFTIEEADLYLRALGCKLAIVPVDFPPGFDLLADRLVTPHPDDTITDNHLTDNASEGTPQ